MQTTNSPKDSGFTPRKEFIKDVRIPKTFSLLAISGPHLVRLYSFPPLITDALRRLFDRRALVVGFREDVGIHFCEFALEGKPWANPKNPRNEKLLVDIVTTICHHGFAFLSTLDYGRESDDRLAVAFSKSSAPPITPGRSVSPVPVLPSSDPRGSGGSISNQTSTQWIQFALSFASGTLLRVINPPLQSTPAILQAVRTSWPRGVVSEQKLGDGLYEFKLKGYKWFDQDTFATDSLHHILSLLSSLDNYSFNLLTSISLSHRSRTKDLWIFSGPHPPSEDEASIPGSLVGSVEGSSSDVWKTTAMPEAHTYTSPPIEFPGSQHRRLAGTLPFPPTQPKQPLAPGNHIRSATEPSRGKTAPPPLTRNQGSLLRKAAPRAQVPVSVVDVPDDQEPIRGRDSEDISLPSVNMTGVGTVTAAARDRQRAIIYETGGDAGHTYPSPATHGQTKMFMGHDDAPYGDFAADQSLDSPVARTQIPALLGARVFGVGASVLQDDSESNRDPHDVVSCEIPISWTGGQRAEEPSAKKGEEKPVTLRRSSTGPVLPGGWTGPLEEERPLADAQPLHEGNAPVAVHAVDARVLSPELRQAQEQTRKSQAGIVEIISQTPRILSPTSRVKDGKDKDRPIAREPQRGEGWVLVDIEAKATPGRKTSESKSKEPQATTPGSTGGKSAPEGTMSSAVKTIAIIDAVEAKSKSKTKSTDSGKASPLAMPIVKSLFSLSKTRKGSTASNADTGTKEGGRK